MAERPDMPPVILLRLAEVEKRVGLRKSAIYAGIQDGTFPAPVRVGAASRWLSTEIDRFIASLISARDMGRSMGSRVAT